jgi:cytidylate kinase
MIAEDAIVVDTTKLTIEEAKDEIKNIILQKMKGR